MNNNISVNQRQEGSFFERLSTVKPHLAGIAAGALAGGVTMALCTVVGNYILTGNDAVHNDLDFLGPIVAYPKFLSLAVGYLLPQSTSEVLTPLASAVVAGALLGAVTAPIRIVTDKGLPILCRKITEATDKIYEWSKVPEQNRWGYHREISPQAAVTGEVLRRWWPNLLQDMAAAAITTTVVVMSKCMLFPVFPDLWSTPRSGPAHVFVCGFATAFSLAVVAPLVTVMSGASRKAYNYIADRTNS